MYQFFKGKEPSAGPNSGSQEAYASLNVESCGTAKTRCQSLKIMNDDKSGSPRLRVTVHAVTQSSPSAVLSFIESVPQGARITHITVDDSDKRPHSEPSGPASSNVLRDVHISGQLTEDFLELAKDNTDKDLETCGVLGAFLENGTFYVTTLIIPKQDSTSNSCQAVNEEEVFAIQNERSLFPVGWIHTHPSQSCFMSSIDLHTHYSYQVMVPEAFAIVVAPTDSSRSSGIFRLTDPGGMSVLKNCQENEFHPHKEPADGSPIYEHCSNVYEVLAENPEPVALGLLYLVQPFQILPSGIRAACAQGRNFVHFARVLKVGAFARNHARQVIERSAFATCFSQVPGEKRTPTRFQRALADT